MEVKIGVQRTPREIVLESTLSPAEVEQAVRDALKDTSGVLALVDDTAGIPDDEDARREWLARQPGVLELTHNHGTESQDGPVYHDGNSDPRGFGHICVSVPDVRAACARFEELGVTFQKRLTDGTMKSIAFIKDPDGYWVEIIQPAKM